MKYDFVDEELGEMEIFIKDRIYTYLTDRGINENRLHSHNLPVLRIDKNQYWLTNINNIEEVYDSLADTDKDIVFNINGQWAEYIGDHLMYDELNILESLPKFKWDQNIKWCFI